MRYAHNGARGESERAVLLLVGCDRAPDRERGGDAAGHSRFGGRVQAPERLGVNVLLRYSDCEWRSARGWKLTLESAVVAAN